MNRNSLIVGLSLAACAVLLVAADRLQNGPLRDLRTELQLTLTPDVRENLPPEIAFTYAIGSFRGLAVDILWCRAWNLKQEGEYYELAQLSDWITKLQPHFPKVWEFHAHNLAYNLADAVQTEEEAWMWVQAGVRLLRDRGIPLNPRAVSLYQQLGFIYMDRVGKFSAEMHWYLKREHAREWLILLGAPPDGTTEEVLAWFRPVGQAPATLDELLRQRPEVAERIAKLKALNLDLDHRLIQHAARLQDLLGRDANLPPTAAQQKELEASHELLAVLDGPTGAALVAFARAKVLREQYHMDPAFMLELMEQFGPLDWRLPYAQAIYWAALGTRRVEKLKGVDLYDVVQTDRIVLHSLQAMAFSGRLQYEPRSGYYNLMPDPRFFDAFERATGEAARRQNSPDASPVELTETHRGFLMWAAQASYLYVGREKAEEYYRKVREIYGVRPEFASLYTKPLTEFVTQEMVKNIHTIEQAQEIVSGLSFQAFSRGYALGRKDVANRFFNQAQAVHQAYQADYHRLNPLLSRKQSDLLPFKDLVSDAFSQFLAAPTRAVSLRFKHRVWESVDLELRRSAFDRARPILYLQAQEARYDPAQLFPEPPGMDEYRRSTAPPKPPEETAPKIEHQ
jgi:hypothetical protein